MSVKKVKVALYWDMEEQLSVYIELAGCKDGAVSTDPCFSAPNRGAVTIAALLKVFKRKKLFNTSGYFLQPQAQNLMHCVKTAYFIW